jgi:hypothetical protein
MRPIRQETNACRSTAPVAGCRGSHHATFRLFRAVRHDARRAGAQSVQEMRAGMEMFAPFVNVIRRRSARGGGVAIAEGACAPTSSRRRARPVPDVDLSARRRLVDRQPGLTQARPPARCGRRSRCRERRLPARARASVSDPARRLRAPRAGPGGTSPPTATSAAHRHRRRFGGRQPDRRGHQRSPRRDDLCGAADLGHSTSSSAGATTTAGLPRRSGARSTWISC